MLYAVHTDTKNKFAILSLLFRLQHHSDERYIYLYLFFEKYDDLFQVLQQPTSPHTQTLAQSTMTGTLKK